MTSSEPMQQCRGCGVDYDPVASDHALLGACPFDHNIPLSKDFAPKEFYQPGKLCDLCGFVYTLEGFEGHQCTTPERAAILAEASRLTLGDRNDVHGDPILALERFMDLAQPWIDATHLPKAVRGALILDAYKTARALHNPFHRDNFVDGCAYKAIAGEAAKRAEKR